MLVSFENPCSKALIPGLDELATVFRGRLRIVRVNMATHLELAARLKIRVVPTLLFFKGGALVEFMVGLVPIQFIVETVANTHLRRRHLMQETHRSRGRNPAHRAVSSISPGKPFGALVG
jgi:thioredoxin-like negative regulator of GroEL